MRPIFLTDYNQDIRLFRHGGHWWSYGLLLCLVLLAPFFVGPYVESQIVFVFIYAIVGVGLLILAGFTGQVSLGHAAFLAIGAYTAGYMQRLGTPFLVYLPFAVIVTGAVGALVGGLIIGVAETLSGFYLPEGFKDVAAYVLLLVVLMVRPEGLFGLGVRKKV